VVSRVNKYKPRFYGAFLYQVRNGMKFSTTILKQVEIECRYIIFKVRDLVGFSMLKLDPVQTLNQLRPSLDCRLGYCN